MFIKHSEELTYYRLLENMRIVDLSKRPSYKMCFLLFRKYHNVVTYDGLLSKIVVIEIKTTFVKLVQREISNLKKDREGNN